MWGWARSDARPEATGHTGFLTGPTGRCWCLLMFGSYPMFDIFSRLRCESRCKIRVEGLNIAKTIVNNIFVCRPFFPFFYLLLLLSFPR